MFNINNTQHTGIKNIKVTKQHIEDTAKQHSKLSDKELWDYFSKHQMTIISSYALYADASYTTPKVKVLGRENEERKPEEGMVKVKLVNDKSLRGKKHKKGEAVYLTEAEAIKYYTRRVETVSIKVPVVDEAFQYYNTLVARRITGDSIPNKVQYEFGPSSWGKKGGDTYKFSPIPVINDSSYSAVAGVLLPRNFIIPAPQVTRSEYAVYVGPSPSECADIASYRAAYKDDRNWKDDNKSIIAAEKRRTAQRKLEQLAEKREALEKEAAVLGISVEEMLILRS